MSWSWCCQECFSCVCPDWFDDFDRDDGPPGDKWTIRSGDWSIVDTRLQTTSSNAVIEFNNAPRLAGVLYVGAAQGGRYYTNVAQGGFYSYGQEEACQRNGNARLLLGYGDGEAWAVERYGNADNGYERYQRILRGETLWTWGLKDFSEYPGLSAIAVDGELAGVASALGYSRDTSSQTVWVPTGTIGGRVALGTGQVDGPVEFTSFALFKPDCIAIDRREKGIALYKGYCAPTLTVEVGGDLGSGNLLPLWRGTWTRSLTHDITVNRIWNADQTRYLDCPFASYPKGDGTLGFTAHVNFGIANSNEYDLGGPLNLWDLDITIHGAYDGYGNQYPDATFHIYTTRP